MHKIDLLGEKFGDLLVIGRGEPKIVGKAKPVLRSTWLCQCSCGKEVAVLTCNLVGKRRNTKSCGCRILNTQKYNFKDLTGQRFGNLVVHKIASAKTKTRGCLWHCICDCGKNVDVPTNSLTSYNKRTCGDPIHYTHNELNPKWKGCGDLSLSHINSIKNNAIKRNLLFSVSGQYLWDLYLSQDRKCILSGVDLFFNETSSSTRKEGTTASLDRIDSLVGYVEGNVRWIHKELNRMRGVLSDEEFLYWCKKCYLHNGSQHRPSFDEYFLNIAFDVSLRSDDPNFKHGAVIVNHQNHIIGTGYNCTIKGADASQIPYSDRDNKRLWMIHAEENAILNCLVNPNNIGGAKIYVTARPCVNCLQRIINFGITSIYCPSRSGTITENSETIFMREKIVSMSGVKVYEMDVSNIWIKRNLQ